MTSTSKVSGITGFLHSFKDFLKTLNLKTGDQIVYYGCVGTCTPFVELLAMAVRGMHLEQVFVPLLDETKAKKLKDVPDVGMQVSCETAVLKPKVIVIMGGLAMPFMPISREEVRDRTEYYSDATVIGVCFMSMFEKAGWLGIVNFDLQIDGTLDPVTVTRYA
jgi:hypothetical protein